ncbi:MAG: hypothetical protein HOQ24_11160 [Mycobacteriaceae bacterium]|nr:hypothetical protein [Mycobacteriaceae bacterium]
MVAAAVTIAAAAAIAATAVILGGDDTGSRTAASTSASPETTGEATPSEITSSDNKPTAPSDGSTIPAEFEGTWRGSATGKGLAGEDLTETVVITLKAGQSRGVWESPEANDPGCRKGSLALTSASAGQLHFDVTDLGGICAGYESIGSAPKVTVAKAGQDLAYSAALPLNITSKGTLKK